MRAERYRRVYFVVLNIHLISKTWVLFFQIYSFHAEESTLFTTEESTLLLFSPARVKCKSYPEQWGSLERL